MRVPCGVWSRVFGVMCMSCVGVFGVCVVCVVSVVFLCLCVRVCVETPQ